MKTLLMTTALLALATAAAAEITDAEANMVLGVNKTVDLETREHLRASLQSVADDVVEVADGMVAIREDLLRCIARLPAEEGRIQDPMGLDGCLADEADGARNQLIVLGNTFTRAEREVRAAALDYTRHVTATGERIGGYRTEVDDLGREEQELLGARQTIQDYIAAGHALSEEQKEALTAAAYRWDRIQSRKRTVQAIVGNLESEQAWLRHVQMNLSDAADQLAGQAYQSFHRAEAHSDFIELVSSRQGLRNIEELSIGARADFGDLWRSVGALDSVLSDLGKERSQMADIPEFSETREVWEKPDEDAVVSRFLEAVAAPAVEVTQ